MSIDELVAGAQSYLAEGYRAVKVRAGLHDGPTDVRRVAAVRAAVGPDIAIMVDCNERLDRAGAQWLAHRFGELDVGWLEEPLPAGDIDGHQGPGITHTPITMLHVSLNPGAELTLPWRSGFNALAYGLAGRGTAGTEARPFRTGPSSRTRPRSPARCPRPPTSARSSTP